MGLLYMNQVEHELWEERITEAAYLLGQECMLYQINSKDDDINRDPKIEYKEPVKANILLETQPKPVLKRMGWVTETDELPYVAYITRLAEDYSPIVIEKYVKISVPNSLGETDFIISDVAGSKIDPLFWTCKLVPYRYNIVNDHVNQSPDDYPDAGVIDDDSENDGNYNYFKRGG